MAFYRNAGWSFKLDNKINPDGAIIVGSAVDYPSISRRKIDKKFSYMKNRYFDPQLYMDKIDPHESPKPCANLISYPWSKTKSVIEFDSDVFNQKEYKKDLLKRIIDIWNEKEPETEASIVDTVEKVINFQIAIGCEGIILPSPLTKDTSSDYSRELNWLDSGLTHIKKNGIKLPVFATLAISDSCIRYSKTHENNFLDMITDTISSRKIDGVYFIVEQMSEPVDTRYLGNFNAILSSLELIHQFSVECRLKVIVNFFGPFGLVCSAVGASIWASDWYKSLIRYRLADKIGEGRARPLFWSMPMASDINLKNDIDTIQRSGHFQEVYNETNASKTLMLGLSSGKSVQDIPAWRYRISNNTAAMEHYRLSMIAANNELENSSFEKRLDTVQNWLSNASALVKKMEPILGDDSLTKTDHVAAWKDAFLAYRLSHNI